MAIAFVIEFSDMTSEQSDQVLRELGLGDKSPPGQIFHVEGPTESGGTHVVDVWESQEALDKFVNEKLGPIMGKLGIRPPEIRPWSVRHILKA